MSLNRKEIDLILSEWKFIGARIQEIYQPNIQTLYMELYVHGVLHRVHVYLSQNSVRLHNSSTKLAKPKNPQRFQQLLQSKVVGMYIKNISHVNDNRIVKIHLVRNILQLKKPPISRAEHVEECMLHRYLYFKLWSNNVNIIYTDHQNIIIDLLYRSPKQNLMPKQFFSLPKKPPSSKLSATTIRTWCGQSFNHYIETYYQKKYDHCLKKSIIQKASAILDKRILSLHMICMGLRKLMHSENTYQVYIEYGNAILEQSFTITFGDSHLPMLKNGENAKKIIPLDEKKNAIENAQYYFEKAKKVKKAAKAREVRYNACASELKYAQELRNLLPSYTENEESQRNITLSIPEHLLEYVQNHEIKSSTKRTDKHKKKKNGIFLQRGKFTIAIGRNAIESDNLLRTYAQGEDIWMHTLGIKGGFVFLRCPRVVSKTQNKHKNQSASLELLLECARIAALFSKARNEAHIDIMYTKVKYLRRVKNSIAQVIPAHTKTLNVRLEKEKTQAFISMHKIRYESCTSLSMNSQLSPSAL